MVVVARAPRTTERDVLRLSVAPRDAAWSDVSFGTEHRLKCSRP